MIGDQSISATLTRVSELAVESVLPARFAGITMIVDDRVTTQAFTDPTSPEIDQSQYDSGRGPCIEAFREASAILVESLSSDVRWPEFAQAASAHGVRSTLSLPVMSGDSAVGALNLYSDQEGAFGATDVETGSLFAAQAGVVLSNAQAYWGARLHSEQLRSALESREPIDIAKGIIMNTMGCSPDRAFEILVTQSQQENRKVRDIAMEMVARAQRRRP
ncbi:GAF and ANTAR domain-containing protein [Ilumatobacter sp.]|uniref:GAF and ANTAR domain-containing protein n=1 Tax=Ilumatobacter sp. TaxID=1967498 RepID=UPI003B52323D